MGKLIRLFKKEEPRPLDEDTSQALRDLAGWPTQVHNKSGSANRHRTVVIQRDSHGRVIGSVEQIDEDEYHSYSDTWGK